MSSYWRARVDGIYDDNEVGGWNVSPVDDNNERSMGMPTTRKQDSGHKKGHILYIPGSY